MNQGKLDMVKHEMARVSINILGTSELEWIRMGKFNSDDLYIYYCGPECLKRNGVALIVKKWVQNAVLGCNLKNDRVISVLFQSKPFNITVIQVYTLTHWCWRSWSWSDLWRPRRPPRNNAKKVEIEWFYEDLQDLLELTPKKCAFHHRGLECKSRKSRDTRSNR